MSYDKDKLIAELKRDEGFVSHAYQDSEGYLTIGIGRLIDKKRGGGITEDEAAYLLSNDIKRVEGQLDRDLPWWRDLDEVRQRVLLNMAFNLGINGLLSFVNTLSKMKAGDFAGAADGMLDSLWRKQVGNRAVRLADMMRTGKS